MLKQRILIETDNATLQRRYKTPKGKQAFRKHKAMPTKQFFDNLITNPFVLPQNTRFHKSYGSKTHLFVTEYDPQIRTIHISINFSRKWDVFLRWCERKKIKQKHAEKFLEDFGGKYTRNRQFPLLFPYITMVTLINQEQRWSYIYSFLSQRPMVNLGSVVYKMPMYNIQQNQSVCMSSAFPMDTYKMPLPDSIDRIFKAFFNGSFNSDYNYNIKAYRYKQAFNNYFIWAYLSRYEPFEIFKQKLVRYKSVGDVILDVEQRARMYKSNLSDLAKMF